MPCWSLHLPCRSLVPATLALIVMELSTSQAPYLQLTCEWTPSIITAPSSAGLGKSLRIFHPSSEKKKPLSVSVGVCPCCQVAGRVRCNVSINSSGLTGKLKWNRRLFIQNDFCRRISLCAGGRYQKALLKMSAAWGGWGEPKHVCATLIASGYESNPL